jgi:hypothetical protein
MSTDNKTPPRADDLPPFADALETPFGKMAERYRALKEEHDRVLAERNANIVALNQANRECGERIAQLEAELEKAKSYDLTAAVLAKDVELTARVKQLEVLLKDHENDWKRTQIVVAPEVASTNVGWPHEKKLHARIAQLEADLTAAQEELVEVKAIREKLINECIEWSDKHAAEKERADLNMQGWIDERADRKEIEKERDEARALLAAVEATAGKLQTGYETARAEVERLGKELEHTKHLMAHKHEDAVLSVIKERDAARAEVEELNYYRDHKNTFEEILKERDRYKAALERIANNLTHIPGTLRYDAAQALKGKL